MRSPTKLYGVLKAELIWSAPAVAMPRPAVRVIVNLLLIANECLPRGGTVEITAEEDTARAAKSCHRNRPARAN